MKISYARRRTLFWDLSMLAVGAAGLLFSGGSAVLAIASALNLCLGAAFVGSALLDPRGRKALPPGDDS